MASEPWKNQIIGYGEEPPESLLAHPMNPKIHPKTQQDALAGSLNELGWIAPVVVNRTTAHVLDGHARIGLAISRGEPMVPIAYVEISPEQEALAVAIYDPIGAMAVTDREQLDALLQEVSTGDAAVQAMLDQLAQDAGIVPSVEDATYSQAIESPIYEPTGPQPPVSALYDETVTQTMLAAIAAIDDMPEDVRGFLAAAAQRHTVFHFGKIAEYYSHADAATQALMEQSALVIIDYERAIELGYTKLSSRINDLYEEDYPDA